MKPFFATACLAGALAFALPASAQVLMLDFGSTTTSSANLTNSPYHTANSSFTDTTWNKVQLSDFSAGTLKWSDNATANGVKLDIGQNNTTTGVGMLDLDTQPTRSLPLGNSIISGVYAGDSVGKDGILTDGAGADDHHAIGLQVGGLAAGTYEIYITGRNTNISSAYQQTFYAGKTTSEGDFDFSGYASSSLNFTNGAGNHVGAWLQGDNYVKLSVTLSSGEFLNIAAIGGASVERRGFFNAVQIVNTSTIPEPAAAGLLAGVATIAIATLRRRRS